MILIIILHSTILYDKMNQGVCDYFIKGRGYDS